MKKTVLSKGFFAIILVSSLIFVQIALALVNFVDFAGASPRISAGCTGLIGVNTTAYESNSPTVWTYGRNTATNNRTGTTTATDYAWPTPNSGASSWSAANPGDLVPGDSVTFRLTWYSDVARTNAFYSNSIKYICNTGQVTGGDADVDPDAAPGVWLAGVCEPNDGFSTQEYGQIITIGSDTNHKRYGTTLHVGTSIDGPWTSVDVAGPNYLLTKTQVEALAANFGLGDYADLWLKASEEGNPANLGSMIVDRAGKMDKLCNSAG